MTFFPTIETSVSRGMDTIVICLVEGTMCQIMSTSLRWPPTCVDVPYCGCALLVAQSRVRADDQDVERLAGDRLLLGGDVYLVDLVVAVPGIAIGTADQEERQHHQGDHRGEDLASGAPPLPSAATPASVPSPLVNLLPEGAQTLLVGDGAAAGGPLDLRPQRAQAVLVGRAAAPATSGRVGRVVGRTTTDHGPLR